MRLFHLPTKQNPERKWQLVTVGIVLTVMTSLVAPVAMPLFHPPVAKAASLSEQLNGKVASLLSLSISTSTDHVVAFSGNASFTVKVSGANVSDLSLTVSGDSTFLYYSDSSSNNGITYDSSKDIYVVHLNTNDLDDTDVAEGVTIKADAYTDSGVATRSTKLNVKAPRLEGLPFTTATFNLPTAVDLRLVNPDTGAPLSATLLVSDMKPDGSDYNQDTQGFPLIFPFLPARTKILLPGPTF